MSALKEGTHRKSKAARGPFSARIFFPISSAFSFMIRSVAVETRNRKSAEHRRMVRQFGSIEAYCL